MGDSSRVGGGARRERLGRAAIERDPPVGREPSSTASRASSCLKATPRGLRDHHPRRQAFLQAVEAPTGASASSNQTSAWGVATRSPPAGPAPVPRGVPSVRSTASRIGRRDGQIPAARASVTRTDCRSSDGTAAPGSISCVRRVIGRRPAKGAERRVSKPIARWSARRGPQQADGSGRPRRCESSRGRMPEPTRPSGPAGAEHRASPHRPSGGRRAQDGRPSSVQLSDQRGRDLMRSGGAGDEFLEFPARDLGDFEKRPQRAWGGQRFAAAPKDPGRVRLRSPISRRSVVLPIPASPRTSTSLPPGPDCLQPAGKRGEFVRSLQKLPGVVGRAPSPSARARASRRFRLDSCQPELMTPCDMEGPVSRVPLIHSMQAPASRKGLARHGTSFSGVLLGAPFVHHHASLRTSRNARRCLGTMTMAR